MKSRGCFIWTLDRFDLCLVYTVHGSSTKQSVSEIEARDPALWFTPGRERLCDGSHALLLSRWSLPCRKFHLFLKFKEKFYIIHLDSRTNPFFALLSHTVPVCDIPNPTLISASCIQLTTVLLTFINVFVSYLSHSNTKY